MLLNLRSEQRPFGYTTSALTLLLVALGTFGGVLFTAVYLAEGASRMGYDAVAQPISALSLGPGGSLQQANFVVFGALALLSAIGWRRLLRGAQFAVAYPVTRVVVGMGLITDGLFSQDVDRGYPPGARAGTPSLHGQIHNIAAVAVILALAAGCFILARAFSTDVVWRSWTAPAITSGALTVLFITLFGVSGASGGAAGIFERLAGGVNTIFSLAVLARLVLQTVHETTRVAVLSP